MICRTNPYPVTKGGDGRAPSDSVLLAEFHSWLLAQRYSPVTADQYCKLIRRTHADPAGAFRHAPSRIVWSQLRGAYHALSLHLRSPELWVALREIPGPRQGPRRHYPIPTPSEWVKIARKVWAMPGAIGAASWIVLWSSMRVSDVILLTSDNIQEAFQAGQTVCHQKGTSGQTTRRWVPGVLARLGVARLATFRGYSVVWELISKTARAAADRVRSTIPQPYTPHSFRRAFITYAVAQGMPLPKIQSITGHESLSALERYIQREIAVTPVQTYDAQTDFARFILGIAARQGQNHA